MDTDYRTTKRGEKMKRLKIVIILNHLSNLDKNTQTLLEVLAPFSADKFNELVQILAHKGYFIENIDIEEVGE